MSICRSCICDICGKHIKNDDGMLVLKAKRRWYSWYESGWTREKIHICMNCQNNIVKAWGKGKND